MDFMMIRLWKFCAPEVSFGFLLLHPNPIRCCCVSLLIYTSLLTCCCFVGKHEAGRRRILLLSNSGRFSSSCIPIFSLAACSWFRSYIWRHKADESDAIISWFLHINPRQSAMSFSTCWEKNGREKLKKLALVYFHILLVFTSVTPKRRENLEYCTLAQYMPGFVVVWLLCVHSTLCLLFSSHPLHATDT